MVLCVTFAVTGTLTAVAQGTPADGAVETVESVTATEAPVEEITLVPFEETPTEEPVIVATDEPVWEPTIEVTDPATEIPADEPTATDVLAETPSPTATPSPVAPTLSCLGPDGLPITDAIPVVIGQKAMLHCTVTVNDGRALAQVDAVSSDATWTGAPKQPKTFGTADLDGPSDFPLDIELTAPRVPDAATELVLTLTSPTLAGDLAIVRIPLVAIIDPAWALRCEAGPAVVGASATVQCEIPAAAWAVRGGDPLLTYATAGAWASGNGLALDAASFTITLDLPCTVTANADTVTVAVILGEGLAFTTSLNLAIDQASGRAMPTVSARQTISGQSAWTGSAWTTAEMTVTLAITAPASGCAVQDWRVQASMTPLANASDSIPDAIVFTGATTEADGLTVGAPAVMTSGGSVTVLSGSGTGMGTVVLTFAVTPDPSTPAGDYAGQLTYTTTPAGP